MIFVGFCEIKGFQSSLQKASNLTNQIWTIFLHCYCKKFCHRCIYLLLFILREKCPNTELFYSVSFPIRTEYGDLRSKSPYSVQMRENTDQKKLRIWILFTHCNPRKMQNPGLLTVLEHSELTYLKLTHLQNPLKDLRWNVLWK